MKQFISVICSLLIICSFSACSSAEAEPATEQNATAPQTQGQGAGDEEGGQRGEQVVGQVIEAFGNEITIQVGSMAGGGMGGQGEMPEGAGGGERPTNTEGEGGGERPEGATGEGERPEGMERPDGEGGTGMADGGMGGLSEESDYSEIIELTDETVTLNVPVGTPVMQFGTEMTFSQITADMYITISMDAEENITSINILG